MTHPWEDVGGTPCPECGAPTGTVMRHSEEERPSGPIEMQYSFYRVEPHARMGNVSNREDHWVGIYCPSCGYDNADYEKPLSSRECLKQICDDLTRVCQILKLTYH